MPALKTYDLFISHAWIYNDDYYRLVELLKAANYFSWRNYSVPEHDRLDANNNKKLYSGLQRQIAPVNAVLIISGMYVAHREWIQTEIDIAQAYGKPIIGIRPRGAQMMPTAVTAVAHEVVGWNTDSIVSAIRRHAL